MKRMKISVRIFLSVMVLTSWATSREDQFRKSRQPSLAKAQEASMPVSTFLNINQHVMHVRNDAFFPWGGTFTGTAGQYPKGTGGLIFAEGMLWGAKVNDGKTPRVRVNGATYASGMKAGRVVYDSNGKVVGSEDPTTRHVWRVRTDYQTADLSEDAAIVNTVSLDDVTATQIQDVYDQYDYDWKNWPADEGAPFDDVDDDGIYTPATWDSENRKWVGDIPGWPGASQTIWLVANDVPEIVDATGTVVDELDTSPNSYGSPAIGMELQLTLWAYNFAASHPLGNIMFKRARLIYTGLPDTPASATLDTIYFTQWSDPDLGTYTDDYVGSDTTLSLGYVYNGNTLDGQFFNDFGMAVPAGGYDFLQGPIVNGDTLGMTSFTYFGAGSAISDPDLEEYSGTLQWFNLMEGFLPRPEYPEQEPWTDPITGEVTKFVLAGDPVTGEGWIDGIQLPPGDRRLVMATGPFQMALNDTADVVMALVGAVGGDNLSSVTVLKYYDIFAQFAYNNNFELPGPPDKPQVKAYGGDEEISLYWGHDVTAVTATEDKIKGGFAFEGYNIYQLPGPTAAPSEGVRLATYDLMDGVLTITEKEVDPQTGLLLDVPTQLGSDAGIVRSLTIVRDAIRGRPISNDITYYFGVSAYSYLAGDIESPFNSLESAPTVVAVTPQEPPLGSSYEAAVGDTVPLTHTSTGALSDGLARVTVIDPSEATGHDYEITFAEDTDTTSDTYGEILWNLVDKTAGKTVLANQVQAADYSDLTQPIVDGIQVQVTGPPAGIKAIVQVADAEGPLTEDEYDAAGAPFGGNNVWHSLSSPNDANRFYISAGGGGGTIDRMARSIANARAHDFEMRFTSDGGIYTWWYDKDTIATVSFEAWDVGIGTFDDASDDIRLLTGGYSGGATVGSFDFGYSDPYFGFPASHWIYLRRPTSDAGSYETYVQDVTSGTFSYGWWGESEEVLARIIICDYGGAGTFPPEGTIVRWVTNKPNAEVDKFAFTAPAVTTGAITEEDIKTINVFPNPYYGFHALESTRSGKWVRFNHLPAGKVTIRIFNLAGTMVRVVEKDSDSQYAEWNLKNQNNYPVASGIYIAHLELPGGKEKVLKLAIVQEEQILQVY